MAAALSLVILRRLLKKEIFRVSFFKFGDVPDFSV